MSDIIAYIKKINGFIESNNKNLPYVLQEVEKYNFQYIQEVVDEYKKLSI